MESHPQKTWRFMPWFGSTLSSRRSSRGSRAYGSTRFKDYCIRAITNREFVERELLSFFREKPFAWIWDRESNEVKFYSDSQQLTDAMKKLEALFSDSRMLSVGRTLPVVGHVSAGEGFDYTRTADTPRVKVRAGGDSSWSGTPVSLSRYTVSG